MMCSANFFPFSWVELQEILFVCLFSETVGLLRFICVDIVLLTKHFVSYLSLKVLVALAKLFWGDFSDVDCVNVNGIWSTVYVHVC